MEKLNYKKTFLLGFGFFSISLTWSLFNSFVPIFLRRFLESNMLVGFIMTLDNYAGLFLQPIFGTLSDKTRTRFGRRMPYLLIGMPLAAILICVIPNQNSLLSLVIAIICLNLTMASFRSPTIALMPDLTHDSLRSKANGIINLMGGLGAIIAYLVGSYLYEINKAYPFYMASLLIIISVTVLFINIKEKRDTLNYNDIPVSISRSDEEEDIDEDERKDAVRNILFLLLAIFFWFIAFNAVEAFFTLYGKEYLKIDEAVAARTFTFFSISMVLFAIPSGILATKIGRKRTIMIGLMLMILSFGGLLISNNIKTIAVIFIFSGACWALININSYPLVISMTNNANVGRYTGYYYLFSSLAAIISPTFIGKLIDIFGYGILFKYSVMGFVLALVFISFVKQPVVSSEKIETKVEQFQNIDL